MTTADNLTAVNVAEGNNHYASIDGILYAKSVVDPDAETPTYYISALAFCPIKNGGNNGVVDIPSSVRSIWRRAFYQNEGVVKITFSRRA